MPFASEPEGSEHGRAIGDAVWARPAAPLTEGSAAPQAPPPSAPPPAPPGAATPGLPPGASGFTRENASIVAPALRFRHHLLVLAMALLGGPLGIFGAVTQELQAGLGAVLLAGVIEESLKPTGIYVVLVKWPYALRNQLYTASFTALSGLLFGLIEACVYVFVYFPDKGSDFVLFRFTVPLLMHAGCSFIFGLGIQTRLIDWANGVAKFPRTSRNFFIAAMTIHGGYNLTAIILQAAGVIHFD